MIETRGAQGPDAEPVEPDGRIEEGLIAGRPVEDRSFEVVEVGVGASLGLAIGAAVAGPIGAAAGGVIGAAAGLVAGEAIERAVGHAAETTDATE
jgi:outer membrane lipoprotein SlyB